MLLKEFQFGLAVKRFGLNPAIEPGEIVGSLQQHLWTLRMQPSEHSIPDNTQQDGKEQTGSDAEAGGTQFAWQPFTLQSIMPELAPNFKMPGASSDLTPFLYVVRSN